MNRLLIRFVVAVLCIASGVTDSYSQQNPEDYNVLINAVEWAPDGQELLFTSLIVRKDFSDMALENWTLNRLDLKNQRISPMEKGVLFASYSPSGTKIAYGKYEEMNWDIHVKEMNSGEVTRLTAHPGKDNAPTWSPDGSQLAFNSESDAGRQISVMNADGTGKREVTRSTDPEVKSFNPQWSPINNQIVYFLEKGDHMDQIFLTDSEGSFFRNLTANKDHNVYPTWASGTEILYAVYSEDNQIYRMNQDGTSPEPVEGLMSSYAKQSPDGTTIAFIDDDTDGSKAVYLYDLENGTIRKLVDKEMLLRLK